MITVLAELRLVTDTTDLPGRSVLKGRFLTTATCPKDKSKDLCPPVHTHAGADKRHSLVTKYANTRKSVSTQITASRHNAALCPEPKLMLLKL